MLKTENEIWKFLVEQFTQVLSDSGYTGWTVLRNYQPSIQGLTDKGIYLYKISKRRIGTQGTLLETDNNGVLNAIDHWFEEILFQVGAFSKRDPATETVETITSEDVLETLQAFVNSSSKVLPWKESGYEVIKSTTIRSMDFETDSGIQEKLPQFDFLLCVEQKRLKKINKVDTVDIETKRV